MSAKSVGATKNSKKKTIDSMSSSDLQKMTKDELINLCFKMDGERFTAKTYKAKATMFEQLAKEKHEFIQQLQHEKEVIKKAQDDFSSNYDALSSRYSTQLEMSRADKLEIELLKTRLRIAESLLSRNAVAEYESLTGHKNSYLVSRRLMMPNMNPDIVAALIASDKKEVTEKMSDPAK